MDSPTACFRYTIEQDDRFPTSRTWLVIDGETGQTAFVDGIYQSGLAQEAAEDLCDMLNGADLAMD